MYAELENQDRKSAENLDFWRMQYIFPEKTFRADLDNVPFYSNNAEFNHYNNVKERFSVRKIIILVPGCMPCGPPKR